MTAEDKGAALVVLPRGGGGRLPAEGLTAATLEQYAPDPAATEQTRRFFAEAGFDVGPLVGNSFSVAAPRILMERVFEDYTKAEGTGRELALDGLPPNVRDAVQVITTEAPPDFGPSNP